jgi:hypothetical protein
MRIAFANGFLEQLKPFRLKLGTGVGEKPRDVPAGMREACHEAGPDGIVAVRRDDRHSFSQTLQRLSHKIATARYHHVGIETHELRRELANSLKLPLRRATVEHQVLPLDISQVA